MSTEPPPNLEPPNLEPPSSQESSSQESSSQEETTLEELTPPTPEELDRYECRACGYTYEPAKGDSRAILAGVAFADLPANWRCPVCGANTQQFSNVGPTGKASGFKENLNYGFGVNTLTPGQKNVLIFGALALAVLFFLSLYGLQ